ncbi:MAG: hypothetical protein AABZ53_06460 [Planctomycetota bacterium]
MKVISQFVVRVFDLIETEGRALLWVVREEARRVRTAAADLAMGAVFLLISIPLFITGFLLVAAGLMWWLEARLDRPLAAVITGMMILLIGGGCVSLFRSFAGRAQR